MRSNVLEDIIRDTKNYKEIEAFISYYADNLIKIGKIESNINKIEKFNKRHNLETELEYLRGLKSALEIMK